MYIGVCTALVLYAPIQNSCCICSLTSTTVRGFKIDCLEIQSFFGFFRCLTPGTPAAYIVSLLPLPQVLRAQ